MFARSTIAASRFAVRSPVFKGTQFVPKCNYAGAEEIKDIKEKENLRKKILSQNQSNFTAGMEKIKFPQGLSPALNRILIPLVGAAIEEKTLKVVRDELRDLTAQVNNPMQFEYLELDASSNKLDKYSPFTRAAIQELQFNKDLKKIPQLYESFSYIYSQLSDEREVTIILPGKPSEAEVKTLENELKAFYFKNPKILLTLKVSVNPSVGAGRIYCFDEFMLDLTTTQFTKELKASLNTRKNEFSDAVKSLDEIFRKPLNGDCNPSNKLYVSGFKQYTSKIEQAAGFA